MSIIAYYLLRGLLFKTLDFRPFPGLASPHAQTFISSFSPAGKAPPSKSVRMALSDGDQLSCEVSVPPSWQPHHQTIALVHGMGGSHLSSYMIRLSRKFYEVGCRVVRINLRGCGSGEGLNQLPYNSGNSHDIWTVVENLKTDHPHSAISLIGFSLGGNIILKMAGEAGEKASDYIERIITVCPVLDIVQSIHSLSQSSSWLYHKYYLSRIHEQGHRWIKNSSFSSIKAYDEQITAPLWGYLNAVDYYQKCSSYQYIENIKIPCDILLAADDPFIDYQVAKRVKVPKLTNVWLTTFGGHLGFIGRPINHHGVYWMDNLLMNWTIRTQGT